MWKAELDEWNFRIFDSKMNVAGYIEPDYGIAYNDEKAEEKIEHMIKSGQAVTETYVTVPMLKFGIFDTDYNADIGTLESQIDTVLSRTRSWREFLEAQTNCKEHHIHISHTNKDMLSITFKVIFTTRIQLDANKLLNEIRPMLDKLEKMHLL